MSRKGMDAWEDLTGKSREVQNSNAYFLSMRLDAQDYSSRFLSESSALYELVGIGARDVKV